MEQSLSGKAAQRVNKFIAFHGIRRCNFRVHKSLPLVPIAWVRGIHSPYLDRVLRPFETELPLNVFQAISSQEIKGRDRFVHIGVPRRIVSTRWCKYEVCWDEFDSSGFG